MGQHHRPNQPFGGERLTRSIANPYKPAAAHAWETTISPRHRVQRALVPTISQAGSAGTMSRQHFGHVYPAMFGVKSYSGPT
jgi:hypothetical protein